MLFGVAALPAIPAISRGPLKFLAHGRRLTAAAQVHSDVDWGAFKSKLIEEARKLRLGRVGITTAEPPATYAKYKEWVDRGFHGEMGYLAREDRLARRRDPSVILPGVQSVVVITQPYFPGRNKFPPKAHDPLHGNVSCYAWGDDYHKIIEGRLKSLCSWMLAEAGGKHLYYVDHGPILERDFGARAGLGFRGKNTLLIDPQMGSGFFLGEILTTLPLPPDSNPKVEKLEAKECGKCRKCLDACPTQAFTGPFSLDARRCISYLTIELKGSIPEELRPLIGNRVYGCDECQVVCPWNRFDPDQDSPLWGSPPEEVTAPKLLELLALDEAGFEARFRNSPIKRIKRARLLRNVAVALGNSGRVEALPQLDHAAEHDQDELVREHAAWAAAQIRKIAEDNCKVL